MLISWDVFIRKSCVVQKCHGNILFLFGLTRNESIARSGERGVTKGGGPLSWAGQGVTFSGVRGSWMAGWVGVFVS